MKKINKSKKYYDVKELEKNNREFLDRIKVVGSPKKVSFHSFKNVNINDIYDNIGDN